jgi:hypothetical protein
MIDLLGNRLDQVEFPVSVGPFSSTACLKLPKAFSQPDHPENCAMHVTLASDETTFARNLFLYLPDKYIDWPTPDVDISCQRTTEDRWKVTLRSEALAKDVLVRSADVGSRPDFSDNFFDLIPRVDHEVMIDSAPNVSSAGPALTLMSVNDVLGQSETPR